MRAFQGTFAVDIWSIKCCVVDIWSIFGVFFWWSIFDKTPVAGLIISTAARGTLAAVSCGARISRVYKQKILPLLVTKLHSYSLSKPPPLIYAAKG